MKQAERPPRDRGHALTPGASDTAEAVRAASARRMIQRPYHVPDLRRLRVFAAIILLLLGAIIGRLWYLQIVLGPELAERSATMRTRLIRRVAPRGTILDAKGRTLATSRPVHVVSILPDELTKNPQTLPFLAELLGIPLETVRKEIEANRTTPFDPIPIATDVDMTTLARIEENRIDLPGVLVTQEPVRYYTDNKTCTHVLGVARPISKEKLDKLREKGYRGGDIIGVEGIEAAFESDLRGEAGGLQVEVDARGRLRKTLDEVPPTTGHTLRLTLDLDLQRAAYEGLREAFAKGWPGAAVAIDPRDGAVLALVSSPSYDANRFGQDYGKLLRDRIHTPLVNRAANSRYPVGSTFKLVTAAAGLRAGVISASSHIHCPGYMYVGRWRFNCDQRRGHGSIALRNAIAYSCDVYFYRLGQRLGVEKLVETARLFGLGELTGIDLPATRDAAGLIPTPEWKKKRFKRPENQKWVPGDLINMSVGQGYIGVTPLQLAHYTAALANGGTLLRPQLVREVLDTGASKPVTLRRLQPEKQGTLGLTPAQRDLIVDGMRGACEYGTAKSIRLPGISIAGKTGTAEAIVRGRDVNHSVFVGFAPVENPKIAVAVLVEGGGYGAQTAVPIARRMISQYLGKPATEAAAVSRRPRSRHASR